MWQEIIEYAKTTLEFSQGEVYIIMITACIAIIVGLIGLWKWTIYDCYFSPSRFLGMITYLLWIIGCIIGLIINIPSLVEKMFKIASISSVMSLCLFFVWIGDEDGAFIGWLTGYITTGILFFGISMISFMPILLWRFISS